MRLWISKIKSPMQMNGKCFYGYLKCTVMTPYLSINICLFISKISLLLFFKISTTAFVKVVKRLVDTHMTFSHFQVFFNINYLTVMAALNCTVDQNVHYRYLNLKPQYSQLANVTIQFLLPKYGQKWGDWPTIFSRNPPKPEASGSVSCQQCWG